MRRKLQLLAGSILLAGFSLQAQIKHTIDWDTSVGANASITINAGDTIEWINTDTGVDHDVVSTDANAPVGFGSPIMQDGDTYMFKFNSARIFNYFCSFHESSMAGSITVVGNPDCARPTDLTMSNLTSTSVEFNWTASIDETNGYNWHVMNTNEIPGQHVAVENGTTLNGQTSVSITGLAPQGSYDFYVVSNCANNTFSDFVMMNFQTEPLNLKEQELKGFKYYPNPATNMITVDALSNLDELAILNSVGQEVLSKDFKKEAKTSQIDISKLNKGTYFLRVTSNQEVGIYKLIKK